MVGVRRSGLAVEDQLDLAGVFVDRADGMGQLGQVVGLDPDLVDLARHRDGRDSVLVARPGGGIEPALEGIRAYRLAESFTNLFPGWMAGLGAHGVGSVALLGGRW